MARFLFRVGRALMIILCLAIWFALDGVNYLFHREPAGLSIEDAEERDECQHNQ